MPVDRALDFLRLILGNLDLALRALRLFCVLNLTQRLPRLLFRGDNFTLRLAKLLRFRQLTLRRLRLVLKFAPDLRAIANLLCAS